ncbi:glycerophosphodiester phosphodiesterase family protein [Novosphingobium sp.]|jgi:glycerophosphoryl diester phosphodiesterase|uniref:glycerophosphodiester phosphodiesterase family protein n=1 Tax=Novosphingobium sp. TaxID=1874826 RepID=UPI0022C6F2AB|nr:glycerophosphodiester phosphodiesterase family protein [Novosphingobium sp.]MCZ8018867.1 glycerophosphodiester phosphodiesterase family protein [Novosphingobium sp.]MCZ8034473.1 glycerophosphodiester phosphodiesterase family protein [Novosphingobium sp.]MCZ8052021.1 glycerophosphodiester phosphodiesterase family protein [Novosphingobium sp.]MCZ8059948.1 glycerophosphodiester phosphodiesterase family protein [Novosphingobium sp.]MCZ8230909.1 glycerophosphodiester phosphodiesterase family pro
MKAYIPGAWPKRIAALLALTVLALVLINAWWLADNPRGYVKLVAHRGVHQLYDHTGIDKDTCTASRIEAPYHPHLENTLGSIAMAKRLGAQLIEVDIAPTKDGRIALFHDWTLDCRTNGTGEVRGKTLAELKALDAGHGYTADGGKTFPFRGKGLGQIPSLEEALAVAGETPLLFNFKSKDAGEAELLLAALKAAGRDPVKAGDGFYGGVEAGPVARMRALLPGAWVFSKESAHACTTGYLKSGWFTVTPDACRNGTLMIPLNYQWAFAGWPNRLIERMDKVGARVIVTGPYGGKSGTGLDLPEQIGEIPATFTGYVWVEDIWSIGPALRPAYNKRTPQEESDTARALEARRAARE